MEELRSKPWTNKTFATDLCSVKFKPVFHSMSWFAGCLFTTALPKRKHNTEPWRLWHHQSPSTKDWISVHWFCVGCWLAWFLSPCVILILPVICVHITIKWPDQQGPQQAIEHLYKKGQWTPWHFADACFACVPCFLKVAVFPWRGK